MVMKKPNFTVDQVTAASKASRRFGELRKSAKKIPQFISENNTIDSVLLDYKQYEEMFMELEVLRELTWELNLANRLQKADAPPNDRYGLQEVLGEEEYKELQGIDPNAVPDDELFD